jgi:ABC-type spermidine/putrescine transport system permease subunit I
MSLSVRKGAPSYEAIRRRAKRREKLAPWLLMTPALVITALFFAVPTAYMVRMSFNEKVDQRFYVPGFTFDHYTNLLSDPAFSNAIWTTAKLSFAVSVATTLIGYAFALLVWLKPRRWRYLFIALALCPLLISEISIIFGWWLFFPRNGLLSFALTASGLMTEKIGLLYTEYAAFVGLVYLILPFSFFILLSLLDGIDKKLLEASGDLGASPLVTFYEVLLPLTKGGIAASFAQSFIWAIGTYATPSALGPDTLWTIGYLIQEQMLGRHNWPKAAAFSMVLVTGVALVIMLIRSISSKRTSING